jgi:UDP-N-acetylmuramyl pentapeptide synthase
MADVLAMTNLDAIAVLQGLIRPGDIILIKGSRSLGMESIADALSRPNSSGGVFPAQTGGVN